FSCGATRAITPSTTLTSSITARIGRQIVSAIAKMSPAARTSASGSIGAAPTASTGNARKLSTSADSRMKWPSIARNINRTSIAMKLDTTFADSRESGVNWREPDRRADGNRLVRQHGRRGEQGQDPGQQPEHRPVPLAQVRCVESYQGLPDGARYRLEQPPHVVDEESQHPRPGHDQGDQRAEQ